MEDIHLENIKSFVSAITDSSWMLTADENTVDNIFSNSIAIEESFHEEDEAEFHKTFRTLYREIDFKKSLDLLIEDLIKNSNLNEHLTLYAIKKYTTIRSKIDFCKVVEKILTEIKVRENLSQVLEKLHENGVADMDWHGMNSFLSEVNTLNSDVCHNKILNAMRMQAAVLLNAVEHGFKPSGHILLDRVINCLESQCDLKLWFILMKKENISLIINLCEKYNNFLDAVLKFFDKFADEIETNYDEDLNFKYSHLNLDFDEFLELFKIFLLNENINRVVYKYLENKAFFEDKNFLFWIDVKACIEI